MQQIYKKILHAMSVFGAKPMQSYTSSDEADIDFTYEKKGYRLTVKYAPAFDEPDALPKCVCCGQDVEDNNYRVVSRRQDGEVIYAHGDCVSDSMRLKWHTEDGISLAQIKAYMSKQDKPITMNRAVYRLRKEAIVTEEE